jgi:hypothetical protein
VWCIQEKCALTNCFTVQSLHNLMHPDAKDPTLLLLLLLPTAAA